MAGESAEDLARRQRERAERLLKSAERYERGAHGERTTGAILDGLREQGWAVFHDVRWPGRQRANIDHVVVGPPGIYVVDSKNWSGRIDVRDNTFRCKGRRQDTTVAAAGDAALAVAGIVSAPAAATTRSVLCFVRDEPIAGWCYDVMVCSTGNLGEMLLTRPPALTSDQVKLAAIELDLGFRAAHRNLPAPAQPILRPPSRPLPVITARPPSQPRSKRRKKDGGLLGGLVSLGLFLVLSMLLISQLPRLSGLGDVIGERVTDSLQPPAATTYDTCAALRKDYPNGVGTAAAVNGIHRKARKPAVDAAVYAANASLDRDDDRIACEPKR